MQARVATAPPFPLDLPLCVGLLDVCGMYSWQSDFMVPSWDDVVWLPAVSQGMEAWCLPTQAVALSREELQLLTAGAMPSCYPVLESAAAVGRAGGGLGYPSCQVKP